MNPGYYLTSGARAIDEATNDRVYYNINITNTQSSMPIAAEFAENRLLPLIDCPQDYDLCVARFSVPGNEIPVAIADIEPFTVAGNTNPLKTTSVVSITINGITVSQPVIYAPQGDNYPAPPALSASAPTAKDSPFYWVFSYQWMLNLINDALLAAYNVHLAAGRITVPGTQPPYFSYDTNTGLISFLCTVAGYDSVNTPAAQLLVVSLNIPVVRYVDNLPFYAHDDSLVTARDIIVRFNGINRFNPGNIAATDPPSWFKITQEAYALSYWQPIRNIAFTTSQLPVNYEAVNSQLTEGQVRFIPLLTDFLPPTRDSRDTIQYTPQFFSRKIPLNGCTPLSKIDLKLYWVDTYGQLHAIEIPYLMTLNIKLVFVKKGLC